MILTSEQDYVTAIDEFERLAKESQLTHFAHLCTLRDAIEAYEVEREDALQKPS